MSIADSDPPARCLNQPLSCAQVLLNEAGEVDPDKFVGKVKAAVNDVRAAHGWYMDVHFT